MAMFSLEERTWFNAQLAFPDPQMKALEQKRMKGTNKQKKQREGRKEGE